MNDKKYLDRDGLKDYDALIKKYINDRIAKAIAAYQAGDEINIEDYVPVEEQSDFDFE